MRTISDADHGRDNNFNLLRMVAATTVMVSHAWLISCGRAVPEPLQLATGYTLGIAAVVIFFSISGYFITKSFEQRSSLADFLLARASRIFPGLVVALLFTAFLLGSAFTTLPIGQYFAQKGTWTYAAQNVLLVHQEFALPQVFYSNPFSGVANASLWTLKYEVGCYAGIVAAGFVGVLRPAMMPLLLAAVTVALIAVPGGNMDLSARVAVLCGAFAFGAGVYVYRAYVPISIGVLALLILLAFLSRYTRVYPIFYAASFGYAALAAGFADFPLLRAYNRLGDYSYGMYIYAFPIGQAVIALMPNLGPVQLIAVTFPTALILAIVSWTWIESPALRHRHRVAAWARLHGVDGAPARLATKALRTHFSRSLQR